MKSYQMWLKGGGDLNGTMSEDDASALQQMFKQSRGTFSYVDGDGDAVCVDVGQIAVFACRDEVNHKSGIGFRNGKEVT